MLQIDEIINNDRCTNKIKILIAFGKNKHSYLMLQELPMVMNGFGRLYV